MKRLARFTSLALLAFFASQCWQQVCAQQYGLASRPSFTAFNNGTLPTNAPTFSGSWSTVPAFDSVTFSNALGICELPGQAADARRMVVWEREGKVYSFPKSSTATNASKLLMLDLSNQTQGWDDSGLLALAFHPNFTTNRHVFLYYTYVTPGTVAGDPNNRPPTFNDGNYHDRLSRFTVNANGTINAASETVFVDLPGNSVWHNGGGLFFHPDNGFLYWTDGEDARPDQNAQVINRGLFAGVFRIDVDQRGGSISHAVPATSATLQPAGSVRQHYYIPNDNPFVGQSGVHEEFFALGLRSPHRMTIDPVTKRIFIGDVGGGAWEEINIIEPGESGQNFQWDRIEGSNGNLTQPFVGTNKPPVLAYSHSEGNAIIGGYVYRGTEFAADLAGKYLFGDNGNGAVWYLDETTTPATKVQLAALPFGPGPNSGNNYVGLSSFGVDADNELYLCQMGYDGGRIYKLARTGTPPPALPLTLSGTGLFSSLATLTPTTGFMAYDVGNPLWSDGAHKQRWFGIPSGQTIGYAATGDWAFPQGSVFLKHFDLPVNDNNPAVRKRLETRVLVRDNVGYVYGMTYKWRADDSDADLVVSGVTEDVSITGNVSLGTLTSTDIGGAAAGATATVNGGYKVTGGGADIWGASDAFRFVHSQKTGDFDIATRIESVTEADAYTKAGLMARESLAADARNVMALVFPSNAQRNNNTGGYEFQSRDTTGGGSTAIYPPAPSVQVRYPNAWLRLKRSGNTFTAYHSRDGSAWTAYANTTLALPATVYFGMAVTAHTSGAQATAHFNFNINRTQPWYFPGRNDCLACHRQNTGGPLGLNTPNSNRNYDFATMGVTDNQLRAWNHVGYFSPTLNEADIPGLHKLVPLTDTTATVEHRMRSYLDSNCAHCHRPGGVHAFWDGRFETSLGQAGIVNGIVQQSLGINNARVIAPQSVERSIMYQRMATATGTHKMPPLAKNLVDQSAIALLEEWISGVQQPAADPLPAPWAHADIGSVAIAGDATYAATSGTFILSASGDDIWNNADAFHFAYQPLQGDGEIIARVQALSPTDGYTKAGVMMRDSLTADSKYALMALTASHGAHMQSRTATAGPSTDVAGPNETAPYYVRLRRQGDVITGYVSASNGSWQQVSSMVVPMGHGIYLGLALCAHNNTQAANALFDNVTVHPNGLPSELHVNFQLGGTPVPAGYLPDTGEVFGDRGNGFSYGWSSVNTQNARDRNVLTDQRYDTLNHMQKPDGPHTWEMALANGTYAVHLVSGDPANSDGRYVIEAEGQPFLEGTPTDAARFIEVTGNVVVSDGRLTLSPGATGVNSKITFVDITGVSSPVSVRLINPAQDGVYLAVPGTVPFAATASTSNSGASISKIEFFNGSTKLGEATGAPFAFSWNNVAVGSYDVSAVATDSTGATGRSAVATFVVSNDGPAGLEAEYWPNMTMNGGRMTRTDANINFDWGGGSPMLGIDNDLYSVRWRGRVKPQFSETYTFRTRTDDGVRLWINGELLVDQWVDQSPTSHSGTITLQAGQLYELEMHFFENGGGAVAQLFWSSPSLAEQTIPAARLFQLPTGSNHRPRQPDLTGPANGQDPGVLILQTAAFQDADATQPHAATDWEIWSDGANSQLVWSAANHSTALTQVTLAQGTFVNSHAGRTQLFANTSYRLTARYKDNSADPLSQWSVPGSLDFTTGSATPWGNWFRSTFTAADQANPAISGDLADPDFDGLPNLLEYALGLTAKTHDTTPLALGNITANSLQVTFPRNTNATDTTIVVEFTTTLQPNSWSTTGVTYEVLSNAAGIETVRATVPLGQGSSRSFVRVNVTRP